MSFGHWVDHLIKFVIVFHYEKELTFVEAQLQTVAKDPYNFTVNFCASFMPS